MQHALLREYNFSKSSLCAFDSAGNIVRIEQRARASFGHPCTPGSDLSADLRTWFSEEKCHNFYLLTCATIPLQNRCIHHSAFMRSRALLWFLPLMHGTLYGSCTVRALSGHPWTPGFCVFAEVRALFIEQRRHAFLRLTSAPTPHSEPILAEVNFLTCCNVG